VTKEGEVSLGPCSGEMDASDCGSDGSDVLTIDEHVEVDGQAPGTIHPDGSIQPDGSGECRGESLTCPGATDVKASPGVTGSHPMASVEVDGVTSGPEGASPAHPDPEKGLEPPTAEEKKSGPAPPMAEDQSSRDASGPKGASPANHKAVSCPTTPVAETTTTTSGVAAAADPDRVAAGPTPEPKQPKDPGIFHFRAVAAPSKRQKKGEEGPASRAFTLNGHDWPRLFSDSPTTESPSIPTKEGPAVPKAATAWTKPATSVQAPGNLDMYKKYIKGNTLLPIPEYCDQMASRTLSFVTTNATTRRLIGVRKEEMIDALIENNIPAKCIYQRSFGTWDVLLPTNEDAVRRSTKDVTFNNIRLQPEYLGCRRTKVTVYGIPLTLSPKHVAAFLSTYGDLESSNPLYGKSGIQIPEYVFRMKLNREGFDNIPDDIMFLDHKIMIVVEGRKPHCWFCKRPGHQARNCPGRRPPPPNTRPAAAARPAQPAKPTTPAVAEVAVVKAAATAGEGWSVVVRKGKKTPLTAVTATSDSPAKIPGGSKSPPKGSPEETSSQMDTSSSLKRRIGEETSDWKRKKIESKIIEESQPVSPQKKSAESATNKTNSTKICPIPKPQPPAPEIHTPPTPEEEKGSPEKITEEVPKISNNPAPSSPPSSSSKIEGTRARRLSTLSRRRISKNLLFLEGVNCCEVWHAEPQNELSHAQRKKLKPLEELEMVDGKRVDRPEQFGSVPMVTTFIREAEGRATGVWALVKAAELAFPGIRMADREHSSLEQLKVYCAGRVPVYVHPSLYRALLALRSLPKGVERRLSLLRESTLS